MTDEEIKHHIEKFGWDFFEIADLTLPEIVSDKYEAARDFATNGARLCGAISNYKPYEDDDETPEFDWAKDAFVVGWDKALDRLGRLLGLPADTLRAAVDMTDEFNLNTIPDDAIAGLRALGPFVEGQSDPFTYYDKMGEVLGIPANTPSPWTQKVLRYIQAQESDG